MKTIQLNKGYITKVSDCDYEWLSKYTWNAHIQNKGKCIYARAKIPELGKVKCLHSMILPAKAGYVVDHADTDSLNNQRSNLRYITNAENSLNTRIGVNNKSGCTGVSLEKLRNKYVAVIYINGKSKHLGRFDKFEDAKKARKDAEQKYYPGIIFGTENKVFIHKTQDVSIQDIVRKRKKKYRYTGARFDVNSNKWRSSITINKKQKHLGLFLTEKEAAQAYIAEFKKHFGVEPYKI